MNVQTCCFPHLIYLSSLMFSFFTLKTYVKFVENFVLGKLLNQAFGSLLECFYRGLAPVGSLLNQFSIFIKFPT